MSMKQRTQQELANGVTEWIKKKFEHDSKKRLRKELFQGEWSYELVIHHVKFQEELALVKEHGIKIHQLDDIVMSLSEQESLIQSASGTELVDLVMLGRKDWKCL